MIVRPIHQPSGEAWIVDPKGKIRNVKFSPTIQSTLLDVEYIPDELGRPHSVGSVNVKRNLEARGFSMLSDLYEQEGRPQGFGVYLDYVKQCRQKGIRKALPDEYFPAEVLERRSRAESPTLNLPPANPAKKPARKAAASDA